RTGVGGPSIGTETPRARQGATAGNARTNASKRAGSERPLSEPSATGAPTLIENDALSPGKIATLTHPRSPATRPVVPRGARPGPRAHALAEHPFERRAPAGEEDHLVVALLGSEGHAGRRERGETELADTQRAQPVEHLGQVGEEHEPQPREERVRVAELRNAA